ncbi:hypothetical protein G7046_g86 [Stylonectria norvegica]|nr:hypothetical protein G7046_g86 [Stylonectria norvegica]
MAETSEIPPAAAAAAVMEAPPSEASPAPAPMSMSDAGRDPESHSTLVDIETGLPAWFCVLGSFFFLFPSFGFMQSIGTVQSYLQLNQLSSYSTGDVGWISGMYTFLGLMLTIQIGPMLDHYGPRILAPVGAVLTIATFLLLAECKTYWQFMLTLGVLGGIGGAIDGVVAVACIGKLFVRRRGLAMGIALTGSSVGSIIFPLVLRSTLPTLGWRWSLRILALIVASVMIPGVFCFLPFPRLIHALSPNSPPRRDAAVLNLAAFRSPAFVFVTAGLFTLEFVIFGFSGLLPTIATGAGFTPENGYTLIAIIGAASCFGRVIPGMVGDRVGHFNVLLVMIAVTIVFMGTLLVPFGTTSGPVLYAFSALWGFGTGSFLSITPVCLGKTCEAKDYGRYYGTMNFVISFALLISVPLSGIMLQNMGSQALAGLFIAVVFLAGACYIAARALLIGKWVSPKTKI